MPTVARTMPSSPKPCLPRNRATTTEEASSRPCEMTVPMIAQNAPLANRARNGSASRAA